MRHRVHHIRSILTALLTVLLFLTFAACGSKEEEASGDPAERANATATTEAPVTEAPPTLERANRLLADGEYGEAIDVFTALIELEPENAGAWFGRAEARRHITFPGNEDVRADYDRAIELDPENAASYNGRGLHTNGTEYKDALADFTKAIALAPDIAEYYINRGNVYSQYYFDDDNYEKRAYADFEKAIALTPEDPEAYIARGDFYVRIKYYGSDYRETWSWALKDYDKAIDLLGDAVTHDVYSKRAEANTNGEKYKPALADIDKALEMAAAEGDKPTAHIYLQRTGVCYEMDDYRQTIADAAMACEHYADESVYYSFYNYSAVALNYSGLAHYFLKEYDKAVEDYSAAIEMKESGRSAYMVNAQYLYTNRADAYDKLGKRDLARADRAKADE